MKARFLRDVDGHEPGRPDQLKVWKPGEIVELPDSWRLCLPNTYPVQAIDENGKKLHGQTVMFTEPPACEPADEECVSRVEAWHKARGLQWQR